MAAIARFHDPEGKRYGIPTYTWKSAPEGLATLRQLKKLGLRPGGRGNPVVAQVIWSSRFGEDGVAFLYEIAKAKPRQPMTPAKWGSVRKALRARRICPECETEQDYEISRKYGVCNDCNTDLPMAA